METVARIVILYVLLMAGLRVMGKREFAQLSPAELVTLLIIPEIVSQSLVREDYSLTNAIVGVATLFSLVFLTSALMYRFRPLERLIASEPTLLVHDGRLLPRNLARERLSADEIFSEMHKVGLSELRQVRWVILEPDGKLSIIPASAGDGGLRQAEVASPIED